MVGNFKGESKLASIWETKQGKRAGGFTLIELAAVMVLLAVFATAVAISLRGPLERIRFNSLLNRIEILDRQARRAAVAHNHSVVVQFDATAGQITRISSDIGSSTQRLTLGTGIRIDRLRAIGREVRGGATRVVVSPHGQSESYALRLTTTGGRQMWLLVCGLSGQTVRTESDDELQSLLAVPAAPRRDAG